MKHWLLASAAMIGLGVVVAQPQPPGPRQGKQGRLKQGPGPVQGPMSGPLDGLRDPQVAERIGITADQRKKIEAAVQEHRLKQIDLRAALEKAQVTMQPLMNADSPDEGKVLSQIDRVHQAQAELQKDELRLQLEVRRVLSADQWKRLQQEQRGPQGPDNNGPQGRGKNGPPQPQR